MKTNATALDYKGFRFPPEIISHAVWLYFRFSLSFRDVEELLTQRGIVVTYETIRQWTLRIRANLCQRVAPSPSSLRRHMAYGRSGPHNPWQEALPLASGGSRRKCARYTRRRAVAPRTLPNDFSANCACGLQYVPRLIITDKRMRYGASAAQRIEQPGGKLTPTHATA
jgi:putative transposase